MLVVLRFRHPMSHVVVVHIPRVLTCTAPGVAVLAAPALCLLARVARYIENTPALGYLVITLPQPSGSKDEDGGIEW